MKNKIEIKNYLKIRRQKWIRTLICFCHGVCIRRSETRVKQHQCDGFRREDEAQNFEVECFSFAITVA